MYVVHNVDRMANKEINDLKKYIAKDIYLLNHTSLVYIRSCTAWEHDERLC